MEYKNDIEFTKAFGKRIRQLRSERGLTQQNLANDIGVEISQISRIERGIINTSIVTARKLAKALNIPLSELFSF